MVQLFISSSTAFCFHANGSDNFNGVGISPLVRAPSDLCFVLAASRLQLCREWNLTHLCLGEKDWMEPLNMNQLIPAVSPPPATPPVPGQQLSLDSCVRALPGCSCGTWSGVARLGFRCQEGADSRLDPSHVHAAGGSACPQARPRALVASLRSRLNRGR